MRRELPFLDSRLCIGCGDCVAICPTQCLSKSPIGEIPKGGTYPYLARPRDCISCTACVLICPTTAIKMKPIGVA